MNQNSLKITELVLRDAHQSLLATRMKIEDMLPIAKQLDAMGYWSLETWGGATFDSCIRYLNEDPWGRLKLLKKAMPNTPQQMLLRAQNILGYRHYADDVVKAFVARAADTGIDVFRIFDAMNDVRNMKSAMKAATDSGKHVQAAMSYTISPVHNRKLWLEMAKELEQLGADSICIKDMAGLLNPYEASELVAELKQVVKVPLALHCHATTGLSQATIIKAVEAGVDIVDTAISSMSMTYGHSATESVVAGFQNSPFDTKLPLDKLEVIASYFREVRTKYTEHEGQLKGIDSRILVAQVPGGMLTNMESQLRDQGAEDRLDEVLNEIPKVREDLGFIPLVTPTSQIVGTQAVINVLSGERYKMLTNETRGVLKGEYGATPAPVNAELQARVLEGKDVITVRPADLLTPEMEKMTAELVQIAKEKELQLSDDVELDVLTYALFPQIGLKFFETRGQEKQETQLKPAEQVNGASASETTENQQSVNQSSSSYCVTVDGKSYQVTVSDGGVINSIQSSTGKEIINPGQNASNVGSDANNSSLGKLENVNAPLAGNVFKINIKPGDTVNKDDTLIVLEAMKMETEIKSAFSGVIHSVDVKEGDAVKINQLLASVGS